MAVILLAVIAVIVMLIIALDARAGPTPPVEPGPTPPIEPSGGADPADETNPADETSPPYPDAGLPPHSSTPAVPLLAAKRPRQQKPGYTSPLYRAAI